VARPRERKLQCRICRGPVARRAQHFPFCSQRCRLIDLGRWLGGEYRIEVPIEGTDRDLSALEPPESEGTP